MVVSKTLSVIKTIVKKMPNNLVDVEDIIPFMWEPKSDEVIICETTIVPSLLKVTNAFMIGDSLPWYIKM